MWNNAICWEGELWQNEQGLWKTVVPPVLVNRWQVSLSILDAQLVHTRLSGMKVILTLRTLSLRSNRYDNACRWQLGASHSVRQLTELEHIW